MNHLLALLCFLASWDAASSFSRRSRQVEGKMLVTRFFLCAAVLLSAFHSLAFLQILSGRATLRLDLAALLLLSVAIATRLAASRDVRGAAPAPRFLVPSVFRRAFGILRQRPVLPLLLFCAVWVQLLLIASVFSAPPRGFDALWYHLPNALRWYRSGTLGLQLGSYIEFYPGNGELLGLPLFTLGNDSWLGLLQYPWLLVTGFIVSLLTRRAGASPVLGMAAGLTALTTPLLIYQAMQFYVDLICAALSLGALLYLVDWIRDRKTEDLLLCTLTLGMLLGTKYVAVLWWSFVAVIVVISTRPMSSNGRGGPAVLGRVLLLVCGLGTALTWIWWVRNFLATGNPLEPVRVKFLLSTLLEGRTLSNVFAPPGSQSPTDTLYALASAYGAVSVLLISLPIAAVCSVRRGRSCNTVTIFLAYSVWGLISFFLFLTNDPRFVIGPVLMSIVTAAAVWVRYQRMVAHLFLALAIVNVTLVTKRIAFESDFEVSIDSRTRNEIYGLPDEIDGLPLGSRVLLRGHPALVYPVSGAKRQNVVYPSPMGPVREEIEMWDIEYVFIRSRDRAEVAALTAESCLLPLSSRELPRHPWWDYWPDRQPQFTALLRVVP